MSGQDVFTPSTLAEALQVLGEVSEAVTVLAGGTDVMLRLRSATPGDGIVLDIRKLAELRFIRREGEEVRVGALTTWRDVLESSLLGEEAPALTAAAEGFGAAIHRGRATLGGNLMSASPSADAVPPLMTAGASCLLESTHGTRRIPVYAFYSGYHTTVAERSELLTEIRIPLRPAGSRDYFRKAVVSRPRGLAKVSLGARLTGVETSAAGTLAADVRLVLGGVAATPVRAFETEAWIAGRILDEETIPRAADRLRTDIRPQDDARSTSAYRKTVAGRMLVEVLTAVAELPFMPV